MPNPAIEAVGHLNLLDPVIGVPSSLHDDASPQFRILTTDLNPLTLWLGRFPTLRMTTDVKVKPVIVVLDVLII